MMFWSMQPYAGGGFMYTFKCLYCKNFLTYTAASSGWNFGACRV